MTAHTVQTDTSIMIHARTLLFHNLTLLSSSSDYCCCMETVWELIENCLELFGDSST